MGANCHFKRLVSGRYFVYQHKVSTVDDFGDPDGRIVLYDLYDPFDDHWLGTYPTYGLAIAAAREALRKEYKNV